ncbi:MAG: alpha/beta fold hydrolase [Woeseiaceae bacterium]
MQFPNAAGQMLSGILDLPAAAPHAYALFAHCFTCSKNLRAANSISRAMTDAGLGVLRFDFTGLGQSEGEFADSNFSGNVSDLLAAASFLGSHYAPPAILVGHSLGGTAVLQAAAHLPEAVAVATIGAPAEPAHVMALFTNAEAELRQEGVAEVDIGGRPFMIKKQLIDDLERQNLTATIGALRKALLILHAPLDDIVDIENAGQLFAAAKHPKSFISLDKADHLLSRSEDSMYVGHVLAAWATRYLPVAPGPAADTPEGVVVASNSEDSFRTDIQVGKHLLVADEPADFGGSDLGPSPYGLLSAALAACTTMTLRLYARHKKLDLQQITARVSHRKIHVEACEDCESDTGNVDELRRRISLVGNLSDEERQRLLQIADKCPVHRSLHGEIKIRSALE